MNGLALPTPEQRYVDVRRILEQVIEIVGRIFFFGQHSPERRRQAFPAQLTPPDFSINIQVDGNGLTFHACKMRALEVGVNASGAEDGRRTPPEAGSWGMRY